jgi:hypothetical protein
MLVKLNGKQLQAPRELAPLVRQLWKNNVEIADITLDSGIVYLGFPHEKYAKLLYKLLAKNNKGQDSLLNRLNPPPDYDGPVYLLQANMILIKSRWSLKITLLFPYTDAKRVIQSLQSK